MTPTLLKSLALVWLNMDRVTLEDAGVLTRNQVGGSDWNRFDNDPMVFIAKLPDGEFTGATITIEKIAD